MTSTVHRTEFMPALRMLITGPLEMMMEDAVTSAAISFCRQSECVVTKRSIARASAGELVTVCDVDGMLSCSIISVSGSDGELSSGVEYFAISPNEISILAPLDELTIWYAMAPANDAEHLPSMLLQQYADAICAGAASILYVQPDRPWTDPKRGAYHQTRFVEGWREAKRFRLQNVQAKQATHTNPVRRHQFF